MTNIPLIFAPDLSIASRKKILKNDEVKIVESFLEKMKVKS